MAVRKQVQINAHPCTGSPVVHQNLPRSLYQHPHGSEGTSGKSIYTHLSKTSALIAFDAKEAFYRKPILLADRDMVETDSDAILHDADKQDVAFLVVGDPFGYVRVDLFLSLLSR